jgi:hypothetical protein
VVPEVFGDLYSVRVGNDRRRLLPMMCEYRRTPMKIRSGVDWECEDERSQKGSETLDIDLLGVLARLVEPFLVFVCGPGKLFSREGKRFLERGNAFSREKTFSGP